MTTDDGLNDEVTGLVRRGVTPVLLEEYDVPPQLMSLNLRSLNVLAFQTAVHAKQRVNAIMTGATMVHTVEDQHEEVNE